MQTHNELLEAALPPGKAADAGWRHWLPVRNLGSQHRERIATHLLALTEADRNLRFGHAASNGQIQHYVQGLNFSRDEVFGVFDSQLVLVAMGHLAFDEAHGAAEFGVSVLPGVRGRSVGGRLFSLAVTHARNRGALVMAIHIARENTAMLSIVRRAGAQIEFDGPEASAQLELPSRTLASHVQALVGSQAADLDYRIKMQVLRLDLLRLDRWWPRALEAQAQPGTDADILTGAKFP